MYAGRKGGSGTSSSTKRVIVKSALERILEEPSPSRPSHEPPSKLRTSEVDLGAGDHTINGGAPSSPVSSSSSLTTQEKAPPSQSTPRCQTLDDTVAVHSLVSGEDKENVVEFSRGDRANDVGENPMSRRNFFTVTYAREAPKTPRNNDGIMGGGVVTEGHGTAFHSVTDDKAENTEVPSSFLMPPASATSQSLPYQKHSDRFPCGGSEVESIGDHRHHHYYVDAEVEEAPSTLLFLSPSSRPSEERLAERGCYPSNSHRYKNVDGIKVSSPRPSEARGAERSLFSTSPPPPQHSKKLYSDDGEGESVAEDVRDEGDQGVSGKGHPRGVDTNIRLVSNTRSKVDMKDETPVEQLIAAAVHEYASYRDAEEAEALNEIREEIDIQNTRYQSLLGLNQSMAKENEAMRAERDRLLSDVERQQNQIGELECQLSKQCEQLEMALQKQQSSPSPPSGSDEIVELEKMWKQEVILFHQAETALIKERDELRDMITQQQSTILSLEHDCREKEKALHESTLSRQQMEAEQQDIIQKMKALGSYMDSVEVMLKEREATVSELEGKLRECEKQKRAGLKEIKEQTNMQQQSISAQLSELRASLDTQTSEVRKKMHRIAVLEKEKKFLQNELDQWRKIPEAMQDQQSTLHRSMVVLSRECHSQWKLFANTTLSKLSNATSSTSDQQFAVSALPQLKELVEELNEEAEAAGAPFLKGGLRDLWKSAADGSPTSAAPLPPHAVIRSMATINAATIRVAQLLGRRSRTLFAACNEKIKELVLSRDALSNEWTREKQLLEDACRYLKEKREKEAETLNSMEMVHQKLEGRVEHLETSRLQLERALREAQEALDSAENQRREKELALQRSNFTLEQTVAELQSSRTRVNELETREEELQQDADRLAGEISALQKTYNEEMEGLKEKLREQSSKLKSMDADKIRWRDELKAANDKVVDLTTQMNAVKSQHTLKRQTQEKDLKASVTELSSLRETINDLKKTLKVEEETHKKEILAKTRIIQELRQRESKQTNELTALSHQLEIQKVGERAALESVLATLPSSVLITETKEKKGRQEASGSQKMGATKEEVPIPGEAETVQDFRLRVLSGVQRTVNDLARVRAALDAWKDQQMRWSVSHQHTPGNEKKGVAETSHAPLRFEDDDDDDVGEISAIGVTSVSPSAAHTKRTCRQRFPSEQRMSSSNGNAMQDLNKCESTPFTIYHDVSPDKRGGVEVTSSFGISSSGSGGVAAAAASQQQGSFVDIPHSLVNGSPSHSSVAKTPNGMARLHSNPTTAGKEGGGAGSGLRSSPSRTNERIPFLHSVPLNRIGQRPSAPEGKQRSRQDSLRPMEGGATGEVNGGGLPSRPPSLH